MNNIILIGMPGSGKSKIGTLLAKELGRVFVDTDTLLEMLYKKPLYEILQESGNAGFIQKEEELVESLNYTDAVIATGGSVVLSEKAMSHLKDIGKVIYLMLNIDTLTTRIDNMDTRGIVKEKHQTLSDIYKSRKPLYEKYADAIIDCNNKEYQEKVMEIIKVTKNT